MKKSIFVFLFILLSCTPVQPECRFSFDKIPVDQSDPCLSPGCIRSVTGQGTCTCQYYFDGQYLLQNPYDPNSLVDFANTATCPVNNPCCQTQRCCPNCGHSVSDHAYIRSTAVAAEGQAGSGYVSPQGSW